MCRYIGVALLLVVSISWSVPCGAHGASLRGQVGEVIRSAFGGQEFPANFLGRETIRNPGTLADFYRQRDYLPAWIGELGVNDRGWQLLEVLRSSDREGLCPEDFHLREIEPLLTLEADSLRYGVLFDPSYQARLEFLLTDAFLLYVSQLSRGRVGPCAVDAGWCGPSGDADGQGLLQSALSTGEVEQTLEGLRPKHRGYLQLEEKLEEFRRISALGGWEMMPAGPVLRPGDVDPRLPLLRKRLIESGDLDDGIEFPGDSFDEQTVEALVRYQGRHGLLPDGVLGPHTLHELNVPVEARIRQMELNLERWRWLPKNLGERHLVVNAADFSLQVIENGVPVLTMPVIVGTGYRKTPLFSARMSYLVFSPYWNVPPTILREDKLPRIKVDPGFLDRMGYEIVNGSGESLTVVDPWDIRWEQVEAEKFPGRLRQKPGPANPLGKVKFIFPNPFDVYLHDTPEKHLFHREVRTFSSGCIRIERPMDLAQYLLEHVEGWDCERIQEAMESEIPQRVALEGRIPVHVLYRTAWVDEVGRLQFRKDLYLRDVDLELALEEAGEAGGAGAGSDLHARLEEPQGASAGVRPDL